MDPAGAKERRGYTGSSSAGVDASRRHFFGGENRMLVLTRMKGEYIRIRRRWMPIRECPREEWVLVLIAACEMPVIAKQHADGLGWINDDLREIGTPEGWQPLPRRDPHPEGELFLSVVLVEIRGGNARLGFAASDAFSIHRNEIDEIAKDNPR